MHKLTTLEDNPPLRPTASRPATPAACEEAPTHFRPTMGEIANRAYSIYVDQGFLDGNAVNHWVNAEAQLVIEHHLAQVRS